ncbi:MAG TPA: hypothetical protein VKU92_03935 [Acidimicrobiales bacterium]|nr:hypothetical protein [Acidimicrobiales bacterium]
MCDEPEALGFEGDRPAAAEGVEDLREVVAAGTSDLLAGLFEDLLVLGGFPGDEPFDQAEESLTFLLLGIFGGEPVGVGGGVVDELSEEHSPARREGSACPPQMQRRGVPVADRLFPGGLAVDRFEGERDLDELAARDVVV